MATNWKVSLTASARYENIERIARAIASKFPDKEATSQQVAFGLENRAFESSSTREEYDQACDDSSRRQPPAPTSPPFAPQTATGSSPGLTIGNYANCTEIADERGFALKVVHTHPPAPHSPSREIKTLASLSHRAVIPLLETFRDREGQHVLVFPFKPLSLSQVLDAGGPVPAEQVRSVMRDVLSGLAYIHERGIIHRDIKPSAILLDGPTGPAYLSDFGTVWHPELSLSSEPPDAKILDIGTGPYRPPDALLGNKSYSTPLDIWSLGVLLSELASTSSTPSPIFTSPPTHEDGSQLGLILSIFRTLGTPTPETWPEATGFRTTPFGMWRVFEGRGDAFEGVREEWRGLVEGMLRYESGERMTAKQALEHPSLQD